MIRERASRAGSGDEITPIAPELAERFVAEKRLHIPGAKMVGKTGFSVHRLNALERDENIPSFGPVTLSVDYQQSLGHPDLLIFEYAAAAGGAQPQGAPVARLHLETGLAPHGDEGELKDTHVFEVIDRRVEPEFREKGIGTRLLLQAEDWVRQVARLQKHDSRIVFATGQKSVIDWLKNRPEMGYRAKLFERGLLRELAAHPERFQIAPGTNQLGETLEDYVFRRGTKGRTWKDAIRVRFTKRIPHR